MVDRTTFRRLNTNYPLPTPVPPKAEDSAVSGADARFTNALHDPYGNPMPQVAPVNGTLVPSF